MGFILCWLLVALIIGGLVAWIDDCNPATGLVGSVVTICIALLICVATWASSYNSYINTRTFYDATREQYANSVEMYRDYALLDLKGAAAIAFTDLKYQDYQKNISSFIRNLRKQVISYNREIISKRLMKKNFFFNWMIVQPDPDMKIVKMTSKATGAVENMD